MGIRLPGSRDVRATLDGDGDAPALLAACPPHPQMGGDRHDSRVRAVSDALPHTIDCLRFDYGQWDEGAGERADTRAALRWGRNRYEHVGLFGYSFGATIALLAGAPRDGTPGPAALSALAPAAGATAGGDPVRALQSLTCPLQVLYGARDDVADWEPIVERARRRGATVEGIAGDHFFVGQRAAVATRVADFFDARLAPP